MIKQMQYDLFVAQNMRFVSIEELFSKENAELFFRLINRGSKTKSDGEKDILGDVRNRNVLDLDFDLKRLIRNPYAITTIEKFFSNSMDHKFIDTGESEWTENVWCELATNKYTTSIIEKKLIEDPTFTESWELDLISEFWEKLSKNPNAFDILKKNIEKINWQSLALNKNVSYIFTNLIPINFFNIDVGNLEVGNEYTISISINGNLEVGNEDISTYHGNLKVGNENIISIYNGNIVVGNEEIMDLTFIKHIPNFDESLFVGYLKFNLNQSARKLYKIMCKRETIEEQLFKKQKTDFGPIRDKNWKYSLKYGYLDDIDKKIGCLVYGSKDDLEKVINKTDKIRYYLSNKDNIIGIAFVSVETIKRQL
jgi:hypothetical protein